VLEEPAADGVAVGVLLRVHRICRDLGVLMSVAGPALRGEERGWTRRPRAPLGRIPPVPASAARGVACVARRGAARR
ncbi:hypothetical protein ACWDTB_33450, partial [Streptomyces sp. NPDC003487]